MAQAGGDILVVAGLDQGGKGIIQSSLDAGASTIFSPRCNDWREFNARADLNGSIELYWHRQFYSKLIRKWQKLQVLKLAHIQTTHTMYAMTLLAMQAAGSKTQKYSKTMFLKLRIPWEEDLPWRTRRRTKNSEKWRKD